MSTDRDISQKPKALNEQFGKRLKMARVARGLSMEALCCLMDGRVTKQAISKYENGLMHPDSNVLDALCGALGISISSLEDASPAEVGALSPLDGKARLGERLSERAGILLSHYLEILSILGMEAVFSNPIADMKVDGDAAVRRSVELLREKWSIPEVRIEPQTLLESHGIYVIEDSFPFDACAVTSSGCHRAVLTDVSLTLEERRMASLREAARFLLCFDEALPPRRTEALRSLFSRELLISSGTMVRLVGYAREELSLSELRDVQAGYGLSVDALMDRARDESIISSQKYSLYRRRKRSDASFRDAVGKSLALNPPPPRIRVLVHKALGMGLIGPEKATELLGGWTADAEEFELI